MDYRHPRRLVRQADFPERRDINDDFVPAAEKLSGMLGPHNLARNAVTGIQPDYYYTPYYASKSVNPGWGQGVNPTFPAPVAAPDAAIPVYESASWQAVSDMSFTIQTSLGFLWINMWAQYLWANWPVVAPSVVGGWKATRIQMAIRVDGRVIEGTVPSLSEPWGRPPYPRKVVGGTKRKTADLEGMFRRNSDDTGGVGPHASPLRCSAVVPVGPGTHLVEMVVRWTPSSRTNELAAALGLGATPYIYSRRALVLDCPQAPRDSNTAPKSVDLAPYDPGDLLTKANLEARRDAIKTAINDVEPGHIRRGALQHQHVTQKPAQDKAATEIINGPVTYVKTYPGYVTTPISSAPAGAGVSWTWVQDLAATLLRTSGTHAAAWPNSAKSLFLILANVRMNEVQPSTLTDDNSYKSIGAFALTMKQGASHTVIPNTIGYVNGFGGVDDNGLGPLHIEEEWDVPLMGIVDEATLPFVAHEDFGVVCASFNTNGAVTTEVVTSGAAIQVIQLRKA